MTVTIQDKGERNQILVPDDIKGNIQILVTGNDNVIRIGANGRMQNLKIDINRDRCEISVGNGCVLAGELILRDNDTRLLIGNRTSMMGSKITMHESGTIRIGIDCMFAGDVRMDTSDMHSILDVQTGLRINPPGDIQIEDHVWLGFGVYVLKGVTIGPHCVVGTGAVVAADIPAHSLAVGVPAKVVRSGVTWDRRRLPMPPSPKP
jgi:acetyltransferase-like isoleucine patch superfamily enzyme